MAISSKLSNPEVTISPIAPAAFTPITLECHANGFKIGFEDDADEATFCSPQGSANAYLELSDALQSWGTDGTEKKLRPLVNEFVTITFNPNKGAAASDDNPIVNGDARLSRFDFIDGKIKAATTFPIRFDSEGRVWTKTDTDGTVDFV